MKSRFLVVDSKLNKAQKNACDRFLLPFKNLLNRFIRNGYRYIIQNDTYTKLEPELAGQRYIGEYPGILNSGDFFDSFDGINAENYSMMNLRRVAPANHSNQTGHELGHALNRLFDKTDKKLLQNLYCNAINKGIVLDLYAAANCREYFAQGCEAFISVYKPHSDLLLNEESAHTRYELLKKDPELFKFIKSCLKKYH